MKFPRLFALALALCVSASACAQSADPAADKAASLTSRLPDGLYAVVDTPRGVIILSLYYKQAPLAVASFVGLAEGRFLPDGRPYFDGISFHRVEAGFVVQGGDPEGSGYGGPGYQFPNEIVPGLGFGTSGVVGMANKNLADGISNVLSRDSRRGIDVKLEDNQLFIDVYVIVQYGTRIRVVAESIQNTVKFHVEKALGIPVKAVNVFVQGLRISEDQE